jgi:lipid II:glycine glycyltransferase (peptidoglycan interpeptide bridge formation enzyme)
MPKHYSYGLFFPWLFTKHWFWFEDPHDIEQAAMVNFFSYNDVDKEGFYKKEGLTTVIDLSQDMDMIWSKMRGSFICKQILKGEKNGIIVKQDDNFSEFKKIYSSFRKQKGIDIDRFSTFKNGILFSAYHNNRMVAGGVFVSDGTNIRAWVLASLHQTSDNREKEIIGQANRILIWEAMKHAKASGHKFFDLGGISPESTNPKLVSLAEFKEAFGGERKKNYYYYKVYSKLLKIWMRARGFKNV